ncbi:MAG: M1 family metallopeptidase [Gammaproteobacteria bacterium]|nr:M1 family metallopeptidase [Gammaproteobacteria bacterium]
MTPKIGNLGLAACMALALATLAGCSESDTSPADHGPASVATTSDAADVPVAQLNGFVEPSRYSIELRIDPSQERFSGVVTIDVQVDEPLDSFWLHGKNLDVDEVFLTDAQSNRVSAKYEERDPSGVALITLQQSVEVGPATLHFAYSAAFNSDANSLYKIVRGEDSYAATQFQAIAARQAFPGFDEPGFKVPFDLVVIARRDDIVVTTTPEAATEVLDDGFVRHVFETTRPLPTYLLAFAVGPYDLVDFGTIPPNKIRDRELPLRAIAARGLGDRLDYALKHTEGLLAELEEYFGIPYPYKKLDLIAAPESFGGAMENVGAIVYDEYLLLMDADSPLGQRRAYTTVHSHEMAHMWFGNLVTPRWWNDIWLNESFASWVEYKAARSYWPEGEFDRELLTGALGAMARDSLASAREIREPIDHNNKIDGAFDGITYEKGAGVLAMLERYVGEEQFRAGVRLHLNRHADGTATTEDFIASLAEGTERVEIEAAFKSFIQQPGVPLLSVELDCEDETSPRLEVRQARYAPLGSTIDPHASTWHVPMCVAFTADGEEKTSCTLLSDKEQSIKLDAGSCPTRIHPNADGAGYYRFSLDESAWDELLTQAAILPPAEALVIADSLDAGFRGGMVSPETYVSGIAALVRHQAWDVADAATTYLEQISNVFELDQMDPVLQAFRSIVQPRFLQLETDLDPGSSLLRQRMQRFLIVIAKDPTLREQLAEQAAAVIGLDGDADPSAAAADQLETIFGVGVQDLGEPFFDLLLEKTASSEDPTFRRAGTGALARVEDPALVKELQATLMANAFKGSEFRSIVARQMVRQATADLTYDWIKDNTDAILDRLPGGLTGKILPSLGSSFCSIEKAEEWEAFITSHADDLPGYERDLAQATESIRLCAALRESSAADLVSAFAAYN